MPIMQVTFSNVTQSPVTLGIPDHLSTLMFQIKYRGKRYDCVGHLREATKSADSDHPRIMFSGYYGYNGPIDIQKLRDAAIDYYQTITGEFEKELRLVRSKGSSQSSGAADEDPKLSITNKSYEFNVGNFEHHSWQKAS